MTNIICVPYNDPVSGYPPSYARDSVPTIEQYHGGQNAPSPEDIDFTPRELLGCVSGELGLREFVEGPLEVKMSDTLVSPDSIVGGVRALPPALEVVSGDIYPVEPSVQALMRLAEEGLVS
jgi:formate dehydrogenase